MPVQKLKRFLDSHGVDYRTISHSEAFTAEKVAASAHIPGQELAKTVMVKVDGEMAMAVLPASFQVDFNLLKETSGAENIELASEQGERIQPWGASDYLTTLADLAEDLDMSLSRAARTFGTVTVTANTHGWCYHPVLGFSKRK